MNIKDVLKKYGILIVIATLFVGAIGYFAYDSNKGKVAGKTVGGKDVIASIKGYDFLADDAYDKMMSGQYGGYALYLFYERAVVAASFTPDQDMQTSAKLQAEQLIEQFKSQYGDTYKQTLDAALAGVGLNGEADLKTYFLHYLMLEELTSAYITNHADTTLKPFIEEKNPRRVRHILVKMENPDKPTTEEAQKLEDAKKALAQGKDFGDVAKEFSDDGSASAGGDLGLVTEDTSFVEPFLTTALALQHGETSAWIKTQYGWHIINVTEARFDELMKDADVLAAFKEENAELTLRVIEEAASKLDIKFADEKIQAKLEDFMRIEKEEETN